MALSVYMDVHVPMVITQTLRRRGLDVLTSQEDGKATADDDCLLARATELGRILFSQDRDFLRIAAEWGSRGRSFPGIVFAAQRGASLGGLARDLELLLTCANPESCEIASRIFPCTRAVCMWAADIC